MGASVDIELVRAGFYPAGGGVMIATVAPCAQLQQISLMEPGKRVAGFAEAMIAGIPLNVATRELEVVGLGMGWDEAQLLVRGLPGDQGPGNALMITLESEHVTDVFTALGEKAVRAETVAKSALNEARRYIASGAAVGEHLADQLLLPMALAGGGRFTAETVSQHAMTNAQVIARFLPVNITFAEDSGRAAGRTRYIVEVNRDSERAN